MGFYHVDGDMDRPTYQAQDDLSTAHVVNTEPLPVMHELGVVPLVTVSKLLYTLSGLGHQAPAGFELGRDVVLLYVVLGDAGALFDTLSKALRSLDVYEGRGAYYVAIDTSHALPALYAGYVQEDDLTTGVTLAGLVGLGDATPAEVERALLGTEQDEKRGQSWAELFASLPRPGAAEAREIAEQLRKEGPKTEAELELLGYYQWAARQSLTSEAGV